MPFFLFLGISSGGEMADTTPSPTAGGSNSSSPSQALKRLGRDRLARLVVVGSFLTVFLLVFALLLIAQGTNQNATQVAERAFTTVLPVLAGWVGTVLAYYFSAASLEATTNSLEKVIGRAGTEPT